MMSLMTMLRELFQQGLSVWLELGKIVLGGMAGGAIVLLFDILKDRYLRRANVREAKVRQIEEWLDMHADLSNLYHMLARESSSLVRGEQGNFLVDEQGRYVVETRIFEPAEEISEGLRQLEERTVHEAIAAKTVEIRMIANRILDFAMEIDPSGELKRELNSTHWRTTDALKFWIKNKDFEGMVKGLQEATTQRRKARGLLRKKA
jgi:hypothetical protein